MNKHRLLSAVTIILLLPASFLYPARGVVADIDFEDAEVGSMGSVTVTGENPSIKLEVVDNISSPFGEGSRSLKYKCTETGGGTRSGVTFWSIDRSSSLNSHNVRISLDIMFQSLEGIKQFHRYYERPGAQQHHYIHGPLRGGIRIDGGLARWMYCIIGFGHDNRMGVYFHTPNGEGWATPQSVWDITPGQWYRIELGFRGLHKGGQRTQGIPESMSIKVSTPEGTLIGPVDIEMPVSWRLYYDSREETRQHIYDNLGVNSIHVGRAESFGPAGASYTFYIDNIRVEHYKD